ncbi:MAG TPA: hypothetical protein VMW17_18560 [Candidatus Binatia bacterium]|nr:hypothetical protein [Candidatus Binatia bacterium]
MHRSSWIIAFATSALLSDCTPPVAPPSAEQLQQEREIYPDVGKNTDAEQLARLEVFTTGVMTDGRNISIRGKLRNPWPERVDGVRLIFRIYSSGVGTTDPPRATFQEEKTIQIKSGDTTALRMNIETMYAGGESGSFRLEGYAKRVGNRDIPPPPGWKE